MNKRATWAVVTFTLLAAWALVVALLVLAFTDWSSDMEAAVGGAVSGVGGVVILFLRMKRLPKSPER